MDFNRMKKVIAGVATSALVLSQGVMGVAAYSDVQSGVWYEPAVNDFLDAGYLDGSQSRFRGGDLALRAEFIKLLVELNGGILGTSPDDPSFTDVAKGAWFFDYFEEAGAEGWVRGDGNCYGTSPCYARPGDNIVRAESSALINRAFGLVGTGLAPQFVDNPSGQWYTNDIQTAADNCVLQGDSGRGTVRPGDNMNRAEMVVMLHRVDLGLQYPECGSDDPGTVTPATAGIDSVTPLNTNTLEVEFTSALDRAEAQDVSNYEVEGMTVTNADLVSADVVELTFDGAMSPGDSYTVFVHGVTVGGAEFDDSASFLGYREVPLSAGTLEVSLNPNTPLGDTIPKGAVGIAMLSVDFTASCTDDILMDGLTLIHEGQGVQSDITNAWMSVNGGRVSRTRVFDSEDQTADLRFSRPLLIEACETVTVDFMADYLSTAATNGRHNYVVELASDIDSNAQNVTGNFPVRGETFEVAAVSAGIITVTYRSVTPSQIDVNDQDAVVGKFELSVDSTEDQTFYSITLENAGTASDGDFVDIFLQRTDGTALTDTVAQTVADYVTLTFDPPFTVLEGDKVTLEVVSDVVDGASDTLVMQFEETNDVFGVGSLYGYGVNGQLYGSQVTVATTTSVSTVTINAGELTIDIDGPVTEEYTPDADDVVMANIDFVTGGEDINVNEMYALITGKTSTGGNLACGPSTTGDKIGEVVEDVEIRNTVTGQTVDGVSVATDAIAAAGCASGIAGATPSYAIYRFDDFVLRGSSRWELRLDFKENTGTAGMHPRTGDRFQAIVCSADNNDTTGCDFASLISAATTYNFDAEGLTTGDVVTDIRPGEDVTGNFMEVATAQLSVTERSLGTSDTIVENAQDVNFLRFEATAGKAEDIFLTNVVVKSDSGSLVDGQDYTLWVDSDDDGTVDIILESGKGCEGTCNGSSNTDGSDTVTFDDFSGGGYTIPAEETVLFEVHADISGSLKQDDLAIGLNDNDATAASHNFIESEEADDGTSLTCISVNSTQATGCTSAQIIVTNATSKSYTLRNQGSLFVNKDSVQTRSRQLLGGELGEAILRLELRANDEPIDVTRLVFTNSGATSVAAVKRLELYRDDESTSFASATIDNCITGVPSNSFCAVMESQQLVVDDGRRQDILVRPLMNNDNEGAVQSNTGALRLMVHKVRDSGGGNNTGSTNQENTTTGTGAVTARGFESSNVLNRPDTDSVEEGEVFVGTTSAGSEAIIVGNRNDVVLAKIIKVEDVNPDPDGKTFSNETNKPIAHFKFTAATNNNGKDGDNVATLSGIVFQISSSNVEFQYSSSYTTAGSRRFELYNSDGTSTDKIPCSASGSKAGTTSASGSFFVQCKYSDNTSVDLSLESGDTITLVLEADIEDERITSGQGSAITVSFDDFSDRTRTTFGTKTTATNSHVQWTDSYEDGSSAVMFTWIEYGETSVSSSSYQLS